MANERSKEVSGEIVDDRYKVGPCLGRGAMGAVYEAEHILMKKRVALKMLHPIHTQNAEAVHRFQQEAQATAHLDHPHICSATDFGQHKSDAYFLVMEFIEGQSLFEIIKEEGKISHERAISFTKQILSAVSEAHRIGIIHRDLKPENILITERKGIIDFVKITDFGVAQVRLFDEIGSLTQAGNIYGSPSYMSPEQAQGLEVNFATDLYSIGIMLYEMLVGEVPFKGKSVPIILGMQLNAAPQCFDEIAPGHQIPQALETLVMKLLSKDPTHRYSSAMEVYASLESLAQHVDTFPKNEVPSSKKTNLLITNKAFLPLIVLVAFLFVLFISIVSFFAFSQKKNELESPQTNHIQNQAQANQAQADRKIFLEAIDGEYLERQVLSSPKTALKEIDALLINRPESSHLLFLQGRALLNTRSYKKSTEAYKKAIQNDLNYASESFVLDDVFTLFDSQRTSRIKLAEELISFFIKGHAKEGLAERAEYHRSKKVRKAALKLLKSLDEFEPLPEWNQLTILLRHSESCSENKDIVKRITELGDSKALGALRRLASNPGEHLCEKKDCFECVRNEVRLGIAHLQKE